jgi:hypothetical protein
MTSSTRTPPPTRPQTRVEGPLMRTVNKKVSPGDSPRKLTLSEHTEATKRDAKSTVETLLGPQVGKRVISPALRASPLSVPANTEPTRRRARAPILDKSYALSERAEKHLDKMRQKREEAEKKAVKKQAKKERKKAAKEKKPQGKVRRGSKREKVSEEQVQRKRARFEEIGARKSSQ